MSVFKPRPCRLYSFEEFLNEKFEEREKKMVWSMGPKSAEDKTPIVQIRSNAMNVISNRNLRENVRLGARIGLDLAQNGQNVVYVNSYAAPIDMRALVSKLGAGSTPAPRFTILDSPIGRWDSCLDVLENMIEYKGINTIVLNSFEYAPISHFQKQRMAFELVKLQQDFQLTIIIFTTEVRKDLAAGMAGRGPIGAISGHAETFWRLATDENGEICSGIDTVHEKRIKQSLVRSAEIQGGSGARDSGSGKERWPSDYEMEPDSEFESELEGILDGASTKMLAELEVC